MIFGKADMHITILSVHKLSWRRRDVDIAPKKSFALSYRVTGDSKFYSDDEVLKISDGDIMYFPKGVGYHIEAGQEVLYAVNFECEGDLPERVMAASVRRRPFFETAFLEMYRAWTERESGYYARTMSYLYRILAELESEVELEARDSSYAKLKPAISMIYSGYMNPELSVGMLAEQIGVSETYFRRIFERNMGERPLDFINRLRISYAKEYLTSGYYNVESVAAMCGFSDSKYFSTVFRRIAGMSPSEYLKRHT